MSATYAGCGPMRAASSAQPAAKSSPPGTATTRWPKRSAIRPALAAATNAISGPGVTAKPAFRIE
jgi:hypothetical protein